MTTVRPLLHHHSVDRLLTTYQDAKLLHAQAWNTIARYAERPCFREGVELPDSVTRFILAIGRAAACFVGIRKEGDLVYPYCSTFRTIAEDHKGFIVLGIGYLPDKPAIIAKTRTYGILGMTTLADTAFSTIVDILNFDRIEPRRLTQAILETTLTEAQVVIDDPELKQ